MFSPGVFQAKAYEIAENLRVGCFLVVWVWFCCWIEQVQLPAASEAMMLCRSRQDLAAL